MGHRRWTVSVEAEPTGWRYWIWKPGRVLLGLLPGWRIADWWDRRFL